MWLKAECVWGLGARTSASPSDVGIDNNATDTELHVHTHPETYDSIHRLSAKSEIELEHSPGAQSRDCSIIFWPSLKRLHYLPMGNFSVIIEVLGENNAIRKYFLKNTRLLLYKFNKVKVQPLKHLQS